MLAVPELAVPEPAVPPGAGLRDYGRAACLARQGAAGLI
jgi:hypothetical protein